MEGREHVKAICPVQLEMRRRVKVLNGVGGVGTLRPANGVERTALRKEFGDFRFLQGVKSNPREICTRTGRGLRPPGDSDGFPSLVSGRLPNG